jgi:predicted HicB family RNase H-like nuclease
MKYKGYIGTIEPDEDSGVLFGRVIGLRDVITFEGHTIPELIQAFHDSVDDYLAFCAERHESPEKPYSGQFVLRLNPRLHRELANLAQMQSTSLNGLIEGFLEGKVFPDVRTRSIAGPQEASDTVSAMQTPVSAIKKRIETFKSKGLPAAAKKTSKADAEIANVDQFKNTRGVKSKKKK